MPKKTLHAQVGDDQLRGENTWFSGATLFLNDQPIASNGGFFALNKESPFLTAVDTVNGAESRIDVHIWATFTVKIRSA